MFGVGGLALDLTCLIDLVEMMVHCAKLDTLAHVRQNHSFLSNSLVSLVSHYGFHKQMLQIIGHVLFSNLNSGLFLL
jgi:hypothetical protein